jgi:hypothetical protein
VLPIVRFVGDGNGKGDVDDAVAALDEALVEIAPLPLDLGADDVGGSGGVGGAGLIVDICCDFTPPDAGTYEVQATYDK